METIKFKIEVSGNTTNPIVKVLINDHRDIFYPCLNGARIFSVNIPGINFGRMRFVKRDYFGIYIKASDISDALRESILKNHDNVLHAISVVLDALRDEIEMIRNAVREINFSSEIKL